LLAELALVINTTTTYALPQKKTPFEVWFGRKPRWITAKSIKPVKDDNEVDSKASTNNDKSETNNDKVLNEIKTRVTAYNAKLYAQMINANNRQSATFTNKTVATLQILSKL
jgi:hypothetical protein